MNENIIGKEVADAAVKVHSALRPGLLESVYEVVLAKESERRVLAVVRQVAVPIEYEGMKRIGAMVVAMTSVCALAGQPPADFKLAETTHSPRRAFQIDHDLNRKI